MTLPVSGAISFNNINVELGVSGTTQASLGQASYRTLAGVPSGAISMSNFYGKANAFTFTIAANTTNANLRSLAVAAGWNQASAVTATINSGVTVYSTSTGTPALTVDGSWPGGVSLVNNGVILGCGGAGAQGGNPYVFPCHGNYGSGGGLALSVSSAVSITNNNRIAGGGGGGGSGGGSRISYKSASYFQYGGGGGGGIGNGSGGYYGGSNGSLVANGSGGPSVTLPGYNTYSGAGGAGGTYGSSGGSGGNGVLGGSGDVSLGRSGGGGGGAVSGNSNITWIATGTRNGGIS